MGYRALACSGSEHWPFLACAWLSGNAQQRHVSLLSWPLCVPLQNSRPQFISAVEDCEYTFSWPTISACPLKSSVHDNCQVTNPNTGESGSP